MGSRKELSKDLRYKETCVLNKFCGPRCFDEATDHRYLTVKHHEENTSTPVSYYRSIYLMASVLIYLLHWVHTAPVILASSGEEIEDYTPVTRRITYISEDMAKIIAHDARKLNKEICDPLSICENSFETLTENQLNLPKMVSADRCFQRGFNKEKCLNKIHRDLVEFQTYLMYVEKSFTSKKNTVQSIQYKTKILVSQLNKVEPTTATSDKQNPLLSGVHSENLWTRKVTSHLILQSFTDYMENTLRAIRYSRRNRA
ncbi:interleukin-6 [Pelodytes ibericus]